MAAPDRFIAWCKQEQASIEQQLELMEKGKVRTGHDTGVGWVDTTSESMETRQGKARGPEVTPHRIWKRDCFQIGCSPVHSIIGYSSSLRVYVSPVFSSLIVIVFAESPPCVILSPRGLGTLWHQVGRNVFPDWQLSS